MNGITFNIAVSSTQRGRVTNVGYFCVQVHIRDV
jgi:hypothetical protein